MIRPLIISCCLLVHTLIVAQPTSVSNEGKNISIEQRYWSMKVNAESYQDYKVIKEYIMDGVWKIMMDSLKEQKLLVAQGHKTISQLETSLREVKDTLTKEREAKTQIVFESSHISVLGIDFKKNIFILFISVILSLLIFTGSVMITKMKLLQVVAKEKIVVAELVERELEEFKKKAMEKQIKLARELQNERNKVIELKQGVSHQQG